MKLVALTIDLHFDRGRSWHEIGGLDCYDLHFERNHRSTYSEYLCHPLSSSGMDATVAICAQRQPINLCMHNIS